MNCFEFKKFSMSDPYSQDSAFLTHKGECDQCRQYLQGILSFDTKLAQAASVKCAPSDFKARLKLRHEIDQQEQRHKNFRWMSYAASIMLAVVALFFGVQNYQAEQKAEIAINENEQLNKEFNDLYQDVVQHINTETEALTNVQATAQARMQSHLASYAGIKNVANLPGLRYSQLCPIGKYKTWHAVMDHGLGLVTTIYFRDNQMPERSKAEEFDYVKVIKQGSNSIMLLGDSQEAVDRAEEEILKSLSNAVVI